MYQLTDVTKTYRTSPTVTALGGVTLTVPDGQLELALAPPDMTTFLSWIEASPPGVLYGESPDL